MSDKVEIRMNKGRAIFMVCYIVVALGAINSFAFLTTSIEKNPMFMTIVVILDVIFTYNLYLLLLRMARNEPVLVLSKNGITTNYRGTTLEHPWSSIKQLEVHTKGRFRHILIDSGNGPSKTDITGLEKQPEEIEELVDRFQKASA